jgi:uncharacterized protein YgiM (DUF1202 family)
VELLGGNITNLEDKLTRLVATAYSIKDFDKKIVVAEQQNVYESADTEPATDSMESGVALLARESPARTETFTPTHTVITELNLRSSASLNATPIGVLPSGTKVQKIGENGDWYYVDTGEYGKGWCFSHYLSPV